MSDILNVIPEGLCCSRSYFVHIRIVCLVARGPWAIKGGLCLAKKCKPCPPVLLVGSITHQANSMKQRKVFESKAMKYLTLVWCTDLQNNAYWPSRSGTDVYHSSENGSGILVLSYSLRGLMFSKKQTVESKQKIMTSFPSGPVEIRAELEGSRESAPAITHHVWGRNPYRTTSQTAIRLQKQTAAHFTATTADFSSTQPTLQKKQ